MFLSQEEHRMYGTDNATAREYPNPVELAVSERKAPRTKALILSLPLNVNCAKTARLRKATSNRISIRQVSRNLQMPGWMLGGVWGILAADSFQLSSSTGSAIFLAIALIETAICIEKFYATTK